MNGTVAALPLQVTFYHRKPFPSCHSIERYFIDVRRAMPAGVVCRQAICRFHSKGVGRRVYNMAEAAFRQGDVNHITGDVYILAFFLRRRRTLLTILDFVQLHRLTGLRKALIHLFWYWLPVRRSALVSVISEFTKQELLRFVRCDPGNIRVVHACVSEDFVPDPRPFRTERPVILQVGTGWNKNAERVAEALQGIPCHLRIIGRVGPSLESRLRNGGIDYSHVANIGNEAVAEEYRRCDLVVFASIYEGFGLPIVEAQAVGRPVVTSNLTAMPEVAGDAACLVDPHVVSSIREGIGRVIRDEAYREELIRRGFQNVNRFRPERIAAQYVALYEELLGLC